MASVNFEKLKNGTQVKALLRHCDSKERLKNEHSNGDINKNETENNYDAWGFKEACNLYDKRIEELDLIQGQNKRKDRVTCFGLCIPFPEGLPEEQYHKWSVDVMTLLTNHYGMSNVIGANVHYDEVHNYRDAETGEYKESRPHIHMYVIPEINGKLNGKEFSSRNNMRTVNNMIHGITQNEYGLDFLDGTKKKSKASVETLKNKSQQQELQAEKQRLLQKQLNLQRKEKELQQAERNLNSRLRLVEARESNLKVQTENLSSERQKWRDEAESVLKRHIKEIDDNAPQSLIDYTKHLKKKGKSVYDMWQEREQQKDVLRKRALRVRGNENTFGDLLRQTEDRGYDDFSV